MAVAMNYRTKAGALLLAAQIEAYWIARGYLGIETSVARYAAAPSNSDKFIGWSVRSNIVDGYPPLSVRQAAA